MHERVQYFRSLYFPLHMKTKPRHMWFIVDTNLAGGAAEADLCRPDSSGVRDELAVMEGQIIVRC